MDRKTQITMYYTNAREFIRLKNPQSARQCVLQILNEALDDYKQADSILKKAKLEVFMQTWIRVSRELYSEGITEYVLQCFGMKKEKEAPVCKKRPSAPGGKKLPPLQQENTAPTSPQAPAKGDIDMSGLIDSSSGKSSASTSTGGRMDMIIEEPVHLGWAPDLCEKNKRAVVRINAFSGDSESNGTGFIISKQGYLLTNDHVVFDESSGCYYKKVRFSVGEDKKYYPLDILFSDKRADVALCRFDPNAVENFDCVKRIQNYANCVKQAEECLVIGNMFGMGLAPFLGFVRYVKDDEGNLIHSAPSNPGDSGGPVFNRNGECIGINKSVTTRVNGRRADGIANATPMDKIDSLLQKWGKANNIEF